jgi:hypothetical protein
MTKIKETTMHASSTCKRGVDFHYDFDRFQLSPERLFSYVIDALASPV